MINWTVRFWPCLSNSINWGLRVGVVTSNKPQSSLGSSPWSSEQKTQLLSLLQSLMARWTSGKSVNLSGAFLVPSICKMVIIPSSTSQGGCKDKNKINVRESNLTNDKAPCKCYLLLSDLRDRRMHSFLKFVIYLFSCTCLGCIMKDLRSCGMWDL